MCGGHGTCGGCGSHEKRTVTLHLLWLLLPLTFCMCSAAFSAFVSNSLSQSSSRMGASFWPGGILHRGGQTHSLTQHSNLHHDLGLCACQVKGYSRGTNTLYEYPPPQPHPPCTHPPCTHPPCTHPPCTHPPCTHTSCMHSHDVLLHQPVLMLLVQRLQILQRHCPLL